jgi:diacylglycerol kinase family enzyme
MIVNPVCGRGEIEKKRRIVRDIIPIFGTDTVIDGFDTVSAAEFTLRARQLADTVDVLVVAGGDGTMGDVINAVKPNSVLAYLPMGTGNALSYSLGLRSSLRDNALRIKQGVNHPVDLILCNGTYKALFASVGIDGMILKKYDDLRKKGLQGFTGYVCATAAVMLSRLPRIEVSTLEGNTSSQTQKFVSLVVSKIPHYGYGLTLVPAAKIDDGNLHCVLLDRGILRAAGAVIKTNLFNQGGSEQRQCKTITVSSSEPLYLQAQGTIISRSTQFTFAIMPQAATLRY